MPDPTPDLPGLRNDKENVMENIFDSAQGIKESNLSYDQKKKKSIGSSGVKCLLLKKTLNKKKVIVSTTLFFSKATPIKVQDSIKKKFGVSKINQYEKYLGVPSFVG